jgi:hypothetical protein
MRTNGVRTLAAWCLGRNCGHSAVLDVAGYPDDVPVPAFGPRLRCEICGHLGADVGRTGTRFKRWRLFRARINES